MYVRGRVPVCVQPLRDVMQHGGHFVVDILDQLTLTLTLTLSLNLTQTLTLTLTPTLTGDIAFATQQYYYATGNRTWLAQAYPGLLAYKNLKKDRVVVNHSQWKSLNMSVSSLTVTLGVQYTVFHWLRCTTTL